VLSVAILSDDEKYGSLMTNFWIFCSCNHKKTCKAIAFTCLWG